MTQTPYNSIDMASEFRPGDRFCIGQILVRRIGNRFVLKHRDDEPRNDLEKFSDYEQAIRMAKFDDEGRYRPLKTAPNLRHGWQLELVDRDQVHRTLDYFYPGRLPVFAAWKADRLNTTPLRETLNRQSGMYRVAAKISEEQLDPLVAKFCRSDGGCLRTILWKRDRSGTIPSTHLPPEKFDPVHDQTGRNEPSIPLLCQEACNLLVAKCRKVVKGEE